MIRLLVFLALLGGVVWFGAGVKLGKYTLFGHIARIWRSEEAQDLKDGAREKAGPALERVERGAKAAIDEARRDPDAGVPAHRHGRLPAPTRE